MRQQERLFREDIGGEFEYNSMEDIQEKTSVDLAKLFTYFAEENQETPS